MNEMTYPERAGAMSRRARKNACADAGRHWKRAEAAASNIGELEIVCLNELRSVGEKINQAAGRDQLLFNIKGAEFCRKEILPLLPEGMLLQQVQACVHIANTIKTPIETRAELEAVRPELQLAFQALGLASAPRRKELQSPVAQNLFSDFVNRTASLGMLFEELETEEPMDHWPPEKLDEFLETAEPVKEKIERAESLRMGRKPKTEVA